MQEAAPEPEPQAAAESLHEVQEEAERRSTVSFVERCIGQTESSESGPTPEPN